MIHQLSPTIPVEVLEKGKGYAVAWVDYSESHDLIWLVCMADTGEFYCVPNQKIRAQPNWTMRIRDKESVVKNLLDRTSLFHAFVNFIALERIHAQDEHGKSCDRVLVRDLHRFLEKCGIYPKAK